MSDLTSPNIRIYYKCRNILIPYTTQLVNVWWDMDLTSPNIRIYQNILIEM